MERQPIKVLLIEDNPGDARLIREMLRGAGATPFELEYVDRLSAGLESLTSGGIDVVLLDLSLPDSQGMDTLVRAQAQGPDVPIVVLTGMDDEALAVKAVQQGAQDYLVKGQVDGNLLTRAIRYAIERQRLLVELELEHLRQRELRERELRSLEQLSDASETAITAGTFGLVPLRQGLPETFNDLVRRYGDITDLALEQRAYRVNYNLSQRLCSLSEELGFAKGDPRDVVEIHAAALKNRTSKATPQKVQAYVEEGRLMVLELMGYLVSYYRRRAGGFRRLNGEDRNHE